MRLNIWFTRHKNRKGGRLSGRPYFIMDVKLTVSMAGNGKTYAVGDIYTCGDEAGERMIARGLAVPVTGKAKKPKIETATAPVIDEIETATEI